MPISFLRHHAIVTSTSSNLYSRILSRLTGILPLLEGWTFTQVKIFIKSIFLAYTKVPSL